MPDDRFIHRRAGHSDKVNLLTDLEYRVWTQYILSADDFGVMRASAVTLQADNDHLANRPAKVVQRCIEGIINSGLVRTFDHQKRRYVFQHDWQFWQKVSYPRTTTQPPPPADALAGCDAGTQLLFSLHPGGAGRKRIQPSANVPQPFGDGSQNIPETVSKHSPLTRAQAPAKRLMANGERLMANGSEKEPPPIDNWARELVNLYPAQGRCGWNLVERPLFEALTADANVPVDVAWTLLKARLELQKVSHQWRMKGMIPRLDKWLREGLHLQELPESPPVAERLSKTTSTTASAVAEIMGEKAS